MDLAVMLEQRQLPDGDEALAVAGVSRTRMLVTGAALGRCRTRSSRSSPSVAP